MPAIFISHSIKDRDASARIKAELSRLGFDHAFLDFDKETGLDIGENWEKRLYAELSRCHAVVLVLTPAWLASKWCFAELTQARALGKVILPVLCKPLGGQFVLPDIQAVDVVDWNAGGMQRLETRLRAISDELARGFTLDPTRPPYPGINAFQKEDAGIYFGRDEESRAVLERLDARRTQGGARVVVIIGASGSGKSSLLKASVLPLLARRPAQWVILPDIRPEKAPREALAKALAQHVGKPEAWRDWLEQLNGPDALATIERFVQDVRIGEARNATVVLPVDQFEEMFTTTPAAERAAALRLLQAACARDLPFMVIATGRSDVLEGLIESSELVGNYETFPLTAMPLERYPRLIEGPAAVAGITVEKGLSERIVEDVESKEALPLLAHMLALLYERGRADKKLTLAEYESLGDPARGLNPIQNSIWLAADQAIGRMNPSERELLALRDAFVPHLVRIRLDDGKRVRQTARRSQLPPESLRLVGALTEARLLTTRTGEAGQEREPLVEVTHESLFKAWPRLDQVLTEEQAFLTDLERIRGAHENWAKASDEEKSGELLYGLLLSRARDWMIKYPQRFVSREMESLRAFIAASAAVADAARARSQLRRRMLFAAMAGAIVILAGLSGLTYWQYGKAEQARKQAEQSEELAKSALSEANRSEREAHRERQVAERQRLTAVEERKVAEEQRKVAEEQRNAALLAQSRFLVDKASDVYKDGDYGTSLALALEALPDTKRGIQRPLIASAESILYRALLALREQKTVRIEMEPDTTSISKGYVSPDGRRVLASTGATTRLHDIDAGAEIDRQDNGKTDLAHAAFTSDGRRLVAAWQDRMQIRDAVSGKVVRTFPLAVPQGARVGAVAVAPDGQRVVVTGGEMPAQLWDAVEGRLVRTLPDSQSDKPAAFSSDGRWLAVADRDRVRVWRPDADAPTLTIGEVSEQNPDHPGFVFFPDGKRLLVWMASGLVQVWDLEQGKAAITLAEQDPLGGAAFSPDGKWLVMNDHERVFFFRTDEVIEQGPRMRPRWHSPQQATSFAFSPDSRLLAATSKDGTVRLWRLVDGDEGEVLRMHAGRVHAAGFSSDGRRLMTVGADATIRIWNGTPGGVSLELGGNVEHPTQAVFSPDSRRIVGRSAAGTTVWDLASGTPSATLPAQTAARHPVFLDDRRVATHTGKLTIWDTVTGAIAPVAGEHDNLAIVEASADRRQIALYGALHLWQTESTAAPARVDVLAPIIGAAFSPDGQRLAVTTEAGLHLINSASRKQVAFATSPAFKSVAYSRDGSTLFVGDGPGSVHVFDAATLQSRDSWPTRDGPAIDLKVSPNGTRLLVVTPGTMKIFDIATHEEVASIDTSSSRASFSPDGRSVVANTKTLRVWPVFPTTQDLVEYARSVMPRALTAQQRKEFFLVAPEDEKLPKP